jgi:dienelactone hydrolase
MHRFPFLPAVGFLVSLLCLSVNGAEEIAPHLQFRSELRIEAHRLLDRRLEKLENLQTPDHISEYQQHLRAEFLTSLGEFPGRTALNPELVGTIEGSDYRIEKLIYESRPNFFVTANLYLPKTPAPHPAVLVPCGHTANGKAGYQKVGLILAKHGIAALIYDPLGQGERVQILATDSGGSRTSEPRFRSTVEHSLTGVAPILLGQSLASYRIWDGMRSIDYLVNRKDIDATRIGCTGNSGGGLMTSYLMALDDRIYAAAPGCFVTTTRIKNESPGPGDAEQNVFNQIRYGMDHADYLILHAPKPTLICAATKDFVPIEGAWISFRQAKRVFTKLGFAERMDLIEANEKHGFTEPLRVGVTRFMRRWLLGKDDPVTEPKLPTHSDEELQCTPQGQVLLLNGGRSIMDINADTAQRLRKQRKTGKAIDAKLVSQTLRLQKENTTRKLVHLRTESTPSHRVEHFILRSKSSLELKIVNTIPKAGSDHALLVFPGEGIDQTWQNLLQDPDKKHRQMIVVDLHGLGHTAPKVWRYSSEHFGNTGAEYFISYMLGKSLVAIRTEDILSIANAFSGRIKQPFNLMASGLAAIPALHAAAVRPDLFGEVELHEMRDSWESMIEAEVPTKMLADTIHGVLRHYDIPDLVKLTGAVVR